MFTKSTREILLTVLCGIAGSLVAMAFSAGIDRLYNFLWLPLVQRGIWAFAGEGFVVLAMAGLVTGLMLAYLAPDAAGSGIPQLKIAYWKDMGHIRKRTIIVKFFAGIISIGGGMSLGKEGPTVQLAAGVASWLGQKLGVINLQSRAMTVCGAAAGLAAAFNTPIAGVTFVLEELLENLNSPFIGRLLLASFSSVFVLYLARGDAAVLTLPHVLGFDWKSYLMIPLVSALAALVGVVFQNSALAWRRKIRGGAHIPPVLRPLIGALITWAAATLVFAATGHAGVLGLGYGDLNSCLAGSLGLVVITLLLLGKWAATTASYAWGGCGGIFAPTLCLGAFTGALCSGLLTGLFHFSRDTIELLAVVGMSACLGSVVRAPVTSIMIVFEMTHEFALVPALMFGALISQFISRRGCRENFYSQVIEDDGVDLTLYRTVTDFADWKKRRVAAFATLNLHCVTEWKHDAVSELLATSQHQVYPVLNDDGFVEGIVKRSGLKKFIETGNPPTLSQPACVSADQTLGAIEHLLVEAPLNLVLLVSPERRLLGIFTIHDLLRSQISSE